MCKPRSTLRASCSYYYSLSMSFVKLLVNYSSYSAVGSGVDKVGPSFGSFLYLAHNLVITARVSAIQVGRELQ